MVDAILAAVGAEGDIKITALRTTYDLHSVRRSSVVDCIPLVSVSEVKLGNRGRRRQRAPGNARPKGGRPPRMGADGGDSAADAVDVAELRPGLNVQLELF